MSTHKTVVGYPIIEMEEKKKLVIDEGILRMAAISCGIPIDEGLFPQPDTIQVGHYNNLTGEVTFDERFEHLKPVQCLKQTLASHQEVVEKVSVVMARKEH